MGVGQRLETPNLLKVFRCYERQFLALFGESLKLSQTLLNSECLSYVFVGGGGNGLQSPRKASVVNLRVGASDTEYAEQP